MDTLNSFEPAAIDSRETSLSDFLHIPSRDLFAKTEYFSRFLRDARSRGFEAYLRPVLRTEGVHAVVGGQDDLGEHQVTVFCSADYLGLARHQRVIHASLLALSEFGASVSSVPLMAGSTAVHRELERELAAFVGTESLVLFPTGHAANVGVIAALCGSRDTLVVDKLVHASILDGARLSAARWTSFRHSDPDDLERVLQRCRARDATGGILVVVEGVYGIDGDVAPVEALSEVAARYEARLMVDDAHATGVIGPGGRGSSGAPMGPSVIMGSLSKALGSMGGWIATTAGVVDYLRYFARTIAFSVGLPTASAAAARAALEVVRSGEEIALLHANARHLRDGLLQLGIHNAAASGSAIMSIPVGREAVLRDTGRALFRQGVWAEGLPFPAVPRGQERIRFRVTSRHTRADLDRTLQVVADVLRGAGVTQRSTFPSAPLDRPAGDETPGAGAAAGTAEVTITLAGGPHDFAEAALLATRAAVQRCVPVPWVHPQQYAAILEGRGAWAEAAPFQRVILARRAGRLVAVAMVGELKGGERPPRGFVGHVHWSPGEYAVLHDLTGAALELLRARGVRQVIGPLQPPLQFLGGGVCPAEVPSGLPLFQPQVAPELAAVLGALGFRGAGTMAYARVRLEAALESFTSLEDASEVTLRAADRTQLGQELARILPVLNATIGALPHCTPLSLRGFGAIADEIRDLILPDLWVLAERGDEVVAFAGGFPDVNAALREGGGGTADIERIGWEMAETKRGSIAWLGVAPAHAGKGLAERLLAELCRRMWARGFREVWLHWELVDGARTGADLFPRRGVLERLEYPLYQRALDGDAA